MSITIEELRNPKLKSGFKYVIHDRSRLHGAFRAIRCGRNTGEPYWFGGRFDTAEAAALVVVDHLNGLLQRARVPADPKPTKRGRSRSHGNRKAVFPDRFKRAIKARDKGCVGNGRYYPGCDGLFPLRICQVDHIDPDGNHSMENGQTLCQNCHGWKCALEAGVPLAALLAEYDAMVEAAG